MQKFIRLASIIVSICFSYSLIACDAYKEGDVEFQKKLAKHNKVPEKSEKRFEIINTTGHAHIVLVQNNTEFVLEPGETKTFLCVREDLADTAVRVWDPEQEGSEVRIHIAKNVPPEQTLVYKLIAQEISRHLVLDSIKQKSKL